MLAPPQTCPGDSLSFEVRVAWRGFTEVDSPGAILFSVTAGVCTVTMLLSRLWGCKAGVQWVCSAMLIMFLAGGDTVSHADCYDGLIMSLCRRRVAKHNDAHTQRSPAS